MWFALARVQAETNTKIAIRGKGSVKEGIHRDGKYDYGEDEELHVLITGNTQKEVGTLADPAPGALLPVLAAAAAPQAEHTWGTSLSAAC